MQDFWNSWHAAHAAGWRDFFFTTDIRWPQGTALYYHSIAADPARTGVLDLPMGYNEADAFMMLSACHRHPIVHGVVARFTSNALMDRLETNDLAAQERQLTEAKVKYVVLHKPRGTLFHWNRRDGDAAQYPHVYRVINDTPDMTVLRVY